MKHRLQAFLQCSTSIASINDLSPGITALQDAKLRRNMTIRFFQASTQPQARSPTCAGLVVAHKGDHIAGALDLIVVPLEVLENLAGPGVQRLGVRSRGPRHLIRPPPDLGLGGALDQRPEACSGAKGDTSVTLTP